MHHTNKWSIFRGDAHVRKYDDRLTKAQLRGGSEPLQTNLCIGKQSRVLFLLPLPPTQHFLV